MTDEQIAKIAGKLTEVRKKALAALSEHWCAGPELPPAVTTGRLQWLRDSGLVEREFGDLSQSCAAIGGGFRVRLSACWWFRLTLLGLAVRNHLENSRGD